MHFQEFKKCTGGGQARGKERSQTGEAGATERKLPHRMRETNCDKGADEGTWRAGAEKAPPQKRKLKGQIHNWIATSGYLGADTRFLLFPF